MAARLSPACARGLSCCAAASRFVPTISRSSELALRVKHSEIGVPAIATRPGARASAFRTAPKPSLHTVGNGSEALVVPQPAAMHDAATAASAVTRFDRPPRMRELWRIRPPDAAALRHRAKLADAGTWAPWDIRDPSYDHRMPPLSVTDPLAHRALEALVRAEAHVRRGIAAELQRAGLSTGSFSVLVVLTTAGGELELRTLRRRLGWSKANATEVTAALEQQRLVARRRLPDDRRAMTVGITAEGAELVQRVFPTHADRVSEAFAKLDADEKRSLASICRKLAA